MAGLTDGATEGQRGKGSVPTEQKYPTHSASGRESQNLLEGRAMRS